MESSIGVDFAEVYTNSPLFQCAPLLVHCPSRFLA